MKPIHRSNKLTGVCYDIRGPVLKEAKRLEDDGHKILKLNIGNPASFNFEAPEDILKDVIHNLPKAQGYGPSNGIYSAKVAVQQYYQSFGLINTRVEDIYIGNGVSELIVIAMQGLLNSDDEILIPYQITHYGLPQLNFQEVILFIIIAMNQLIGNRILTISKLKLLLKLGL